MAHLGAGAQAGRCAHAQETLPEVAIKLGPAALLVCLLQPQYVWHPMRHRITCWQHTCDEWPYLKAPVCSSDVQGSKGVGAQAGRSAMLETPC